MTNFKTMPENIKMLYESAQDNSEYTLIPEIFLNALFFTTASAMALKNTRIVRKTNRGEKIIIPSFFAISFASQGTGKDHSFNLASSLYHDKFDKFETLAEQFYDARKDEDGKPDPRYLNLSSYFVPVSSSEQGIQKAAQTISDMQAGSVNVLATELG